MSASCLYKNNPAAGEVSICSPEKRKEQGAINTCESSTRGIDKEPNDWDEKNETKPSQEENQG